MSQIESIQPSQLYICEDKLLELEQSKSVLAAVPIKRIGDICFATDGHTRLLSYYNRELKEIQVESEKEKLDWMAYLVCVNWCISEGIFSIADLANRVVGAKEYETLWLQRCKAMHRDLRKDCLSYLSVEEINESNYKSEKCEHILRSLPEWFGLEEATRDYIERVKAEVFFAAKVGRVPIGFVALKQIDVSSFEISVMGVYREFHTKGIGKKMVEKANDYLQRKKIPYLFVRTLSSKRENKYYAATREFYLSCGFAAYKELPNYWSINNPCLLMRKIVDDKTKLGNGVLQRRGKYDK